MQGHKLAKWKQVAGKDLFQIANIALGYFSHKDHSAFK